MLGLQGVNDKLVLILRQDHALVFRAYDSTSGNQLGEVIIDDMRKPGTNVNNNDNGNDNYNSDDNDNVDDNDNDNNDNDL